MGASVRRPGMVHGMGCIFPQQLEISGSPRIHEQPEPPGRWIFYFSESGNRIKQKHYQAWQVINTAQGKGGSGGRIEALEELNADGVPLVGVDVSSAFLQGLTLERANLLRADFSSA